MEQFPTPSSPQTTQAIPSASKLLGQAVKWYLSHFRLILGITIIPLILSVPWIFMSESALSSSGTAMIGILYIIVVAVIGYLSQLALLVAITQEGITVSSAYKKGFLFFWPFIWVGFLTCLSVLGGFWLFIIPGIIISIFLSQSAYVLFVEGSRGTSALAKSWHYVKGRAGSVFWRSLFLGIIVLLIALVVGLVVGGSTLINQIKNIGQTAVITTKPAASALNQIVNVILNQIILAPLSIIYGYLLFIALKTTKTEILDEDRERKLKKKITIFMIIGIIGIIVIPLLIVMFLFGIQDQASLVPTIINSLP